MQQTTDTILMVRPINFRMNEQTAVNNYFQEDMSLRNTEINSKSQREFDVFVEKLESAGINVIVVNDDVLMDTPDSIFPNNWVSFHSNGCVAIYPMFAENRRLERREEVFIKLEEEGFKIENIIDYTSAEEEGYFLEGTGSICMDRVNKKAYCALSPRADEELFIEFCEDFEYFPVIFTANQSVNGERLPIYHTNVMMSIGTAFCAICLDSIDDREERQAVREELEGDGLEVIELSETQIEHFAGNMLELQGTDGAVIAMSSSALHALNDIQLAQLKAHGQVVHADLTTIETCGGGSARCMIAEIHLSKA